MDFGEMVDVDIALDRHDEDCYFCNAKDEPKEEENVLEADYEDDEGPEALDGMSPEGIKFKNDSGKLTKALKGPEPDKWPNMTNAAGTEKRLPTRAAAHHLIPGNGSLKPSDLYESKKYLWTDGKAKGNIGYNVNSSPNGVWLPGNYAARPWGTKGATFGQQNKIDSTAYAFKAIEAWQAQFHDAHKKYNVFVEGVLNKVFDKLESGVEIWCPKAKKKDPSPENREPLYVLVNRLHTISARMRKMLVFPTNNWRANVWTSEFSSEYMSQLKKHKKHKKAKS